MNAKKEIARVKYSSRRSILCLKYKNGDLMIPSGV